MNNEIAHLYRMSNSYHGWLQQLCVRFLRRKWNWNCDAYDQPRCVGMVMELNYFSVRIIIVWNRLSDEMVNAFVAFHLLITNLLTPIWNLDLLVNLNSALSISIFNGLLILLTCVTKLFRYFNRYIRMLFVFYCIM